MWAKKEWRRAKAGLRLFLKVIVDSASQFFFTSLVLSFARTPQIPLLANVTHSAWIEPVNEDWVIEE